MFDCATEFNQHLINQKRKKWALLESQYLGNEIQLPTELIKHISEFAFASWDLTNVTDARHMFTGSKSLHQL